MNFRLTFIIVLLLFVPIVCTNTAYADAVTTSYAETPDRTQMRWEFHCDTLAACSGGPNAGQKDWISILSVDNQTNTLIFFSRHQVELHPADEGPGVAFEIEVPFATFNALPVGPAFTVIRTMSVVHPAFPTNHNDIYVLFARRSQVGQGFDFVLRSTHVPEPITLLLLSTGLAGVAIKTRKRLKGRMRS